MEKLNFRAIENMEETDFFLDKVENYTGVRLPLNYVKNSKIVGAFLHDRMVAGYILVTKPEFRSLLFVPDETKKSHSFFTNDPYEMMEVNGLWIGPSIKDPSLQFKVWINLIKDIFMSRKKYVLLMSNSTNKNIGYLHSLANPSLLYEGPPVLMAGDECYPKIKVSFTTRWNVVLNMHKYWMVIRNRQQRAKVFAKQKIYARALN